MVSIMRSEQTLRLIQLYHANYPEIARNNQDADGRNLKLQMWAQITDELNRIFDTTFTVEQFKKKVQNVQCTSRQKLFSGKRNLGEAEVEYLRLFESDKISEETLAHRAKNRRVSMHSAADFLMLRERHRLGDCHNGNEEKRSQMGQEEEEEEEEDEQTEGEEGSTTPEGMGGEAKLEGKGTDGSERGQRTHDGTGTATMGTEGGRIDGTTAMGTTNDAVEAGNESSAVTAALSSIGALFGAYGGGADCAQMDMWTQQFLMAMMNGTTTVTGQNAGGEGAEGAATEANGSRTTTTTVRARERKRRQRMPGEQSTRGEEQNNFGAPAPKRRDEDGTMGEEGEGDAEPSWAAELLKIQREVLGQQRQMLAQFGNGAPKVLRVPSSSCATASESASNASPASSSSASPLPLSAFASHAGACQCLTNKNGGAALLSLERELCARLDTTNALLARVVQLIQERLPQLGGTC